ncbi:unnamed protein product [Camellia sinensis]
MWAHTHMRHLVIYLVENLRPLAFSFDPTRGRPIRTNTIHKYTSQPSTKSGNAASMNVEDPPSSASASASASVSTNLTKSSVAADVPPAPPSGDTTVDPQPPPSPPPPPPPPQPQSKVVIPSRDPDALFSGGGISFLTGNKNARFSYGYSSFKGKRSSMEDFYETRISEVDGQMVAFFGVFDGHGGSRTAEYLKNNLFKNLSSHPDFIKDTKSAIVESFRQTDVDYLNEEKGQQKDAGSTASTAMLLGDRLLVANVGDSRVVACRAGSAIPLSIDHKPDRSDERQRIEQAGGFIIWAVILRSATSGDPIAADKEVEGAEISERTRGAMERGSRRDKGGEESGDSFDAVMVVEGRSTDMGIQGLSKGPQKGHDGPGNFLGSTDLINMGQKINYQQTQFVSQKDGPFKQYIEYKDGPQVRDCLNPNELGPVGYSNGVHTLVEDIGAEFRTQEAEVRSDLFDVKGRPLGEREVQRRLSSGMKGDADGDGDVYLQRDSQNRLSQDEIQLGLADRVVDSVEGEQRLAAEVAEWVDDRIEDENDAELLSRKVDEGCFEPTEVLQALNTYGSGSDESSEYNSGSVREGDDQEESDLDLINLFSKKVLEILSRHDHKTDFSDGFYNVWIFGTWRVGGVLAVSRAFGDKLLKPYVVAEPEIQTKGFEEEEIDGVDFIIIASDGLWNVLSNKDAVAIVQDIADAEAASRKLIEAAYAKGSSDNITCVVVRFENVLRTLKNDQANGLKKRLIIWPCFTFNKWLSIVQCDD